MRLKEIGIGLGISALFAALLISVDAFEAIYDFTRAYEAWEVDDILLVLLSVIPAALTMLWYKARLHKGKAHEARMELLRVFQHSSRTQRVFAKRIDRLKELAEALRASEQRCRDFAEAASDRFWELDSDLRFSYVSDPNGRVSLPPASDLLGKTRWEAHGGDPEQDPLWRAHRKLLVAAKPFEDFRFHRSGPQGERHYWSVSGKPLFGGDGRFLGYRGTSRNITRAVEQEEALKAALRKAEVANDTKSSFLTAMSHELRTPLNAIIGFSELIKDDTLALDEARRREYAADILESGQHLLDLINDILDLSKIESGKAELFEEALDVADLAASAERLVRARAAQAGVALVRDLPEDARWLWGDPRKLKQILVNLLANAVKFSQAGGRVTVRIRRGPDGYRIEVEDQGIGMAPEDIPKALSLFGQVDSELGRKYEGTGLGLPLTKALVELHGGTLELRSEIDVGTTAIVRLPLWRLDGPGADPKTFRRDSSAA